MAYDFSLDDLVEIIRESQGLSKEDVITADMLLERDLGITGDDGLELLEELERRLGISFVGRDGTLREAFHLAKDEYLFHSEGFSLLGCIVSLFGKDLEKVKLLTVGQLHEAVLASTH